MMFGKIKKKKLHLVLLLNHRDTLPYMTSIVSFLQLASKRFQNITNYLLVARAAFIKIVTVAVSGTRIITKN